MRKGLIDRLKNCHKKKDWHAFLACQSFYLLFDIYNNVYINNIRTDYLASAGTSAGVS